MVLVGLMVLGGLALLGYITGPSKPAPVSDSRPDNGPVLMPSSETAVAAATAAEVGAAVTTVPPTGANPDGFSPIVPTNPPAPAAFVAPPGQPFDRPLYGPAGSVVSSIAPLSSVRVTHKHRGQDCVGILEVTAAQMRFLSSEPEDAFSVPLSAVEKPKATADGKGFTVRINDDKGLRFEPFNESAARLGAFYAELVAALDGITPQDGGALAQR